jgi:hypothetical protein
MVQALEDEKQKLLERQKRFGFVAGVSDEDEKKKKRLERFGPTNEDEVVLLTIKLLTDITSCI